jgi:hypothetical protein
MNVRAGRMWRTVTAAALIIASISMEQTRAGITFGTPRNLGSKVNSSDSEFDPRISRDGLALLFNSNRNGGRGSGTSG